jgi:hypothetical protein
MTIQELNEVLSGKTIKSVEPTPNRPGSVTINLDGGGIIEHEQVYITASCVRDLFTLHYHGNQSPKGDEDWPLKDERCCHYDGRPVHQDGLCAHHFKEKAKREKHRQEQYIRLESMEQL